MCLGHVLWEPYDVQVAPMSGRDCVIIRNCNLYRVLGWPDFVTGTSVMTKCPVGAQTSNSHSLWNRYSACYHVCKLMARYGAISGGCCGFVSGLPVVRCVKGDHSCIIIVILILIIQVWFYIRAKRGGGQLSNI